MSPLHIEADGLALTFGKWTELLIVFVLGIVLARSTMFCVAHIQNLPTWVYVAVALFVFFLLCLDMGILAVLLKSICFSKLIG